MGYLDAISLKKNEIQKERGNVEPFVKIGLEIQLIRTCISCIFLCVSDCYLKSRGVNSVR